ncbi:MAG TPA: aquaporin [Candidatus Saccharimonadales bacterium]|nr:aquaporin [Candidatus Saccharimonadales bacterium]
MFGRNKVAALLAEFFGTAILTLVVLSVHYSNVGVAYFVSLAAGLTVAVMLFAVGKVSGAHLNPGLTIGLWTARKITTVRAVVYIVAQLLGAWAAYGLYSYFVNQSLPVTGAHFEGRILVAEIVGTFIFAFGWAAALYRGMDGGLFATTAGIAFAIGMIVAAAVGVGLINPALALGIRAWLPWGSGVTGWGTYVLGPVLGALAGVNVYAWFFAPEVAGARRAAATATVSSSSTAKKPAAKKRATAKKKR